MEPEDTGSKWPWAPAGCVHLVKFPPQSLGFLRQMKTMRPTAQICREDPGRRPRKVPQTPPGTWQELNTREPLFSSCMTLPSLEWRERVRKCPKQGIHQQREENGEPPRGSLSTRWEGQSRTLGPFHSAGLPSWPRAPSDPRQPGGAATRATRGPSWEPSEPPHVPPQLGG